MRNFTFRFVFVVLLSFQSLFGSSFSMLCEDNLTSIMGFLSSVERAKVAPVSHFFKDMSEKSNVIDRIFSGPILDQILMSRTKEDLERAFRQVHHLCFISPRALEIASHWSERLGRFWSDQKIEASACLLKLHPSIDPHLKIEIPAFPITSSEILLAFKQVKKLAHLTQMESDILLKAENHFVISNFVTNATQEIVGVRQTILFPTWIEGSFVFAPGHKTFEIVQNADIGLQKGLQFTERGFLKISKKKKINMDPIIFTKTGNRLTCLYQDKEYDFYLAPGAQFMSHNNMPDGFKESCDLIVHGNFYF